MVKFKFKRKCTIKVVNYTIKAHPPQENIIDCILKIEIRKFKFSIKKEYINTCKSDLNLYKCLVKFLSDLNKSVRSYQLILIQLYNQLLPIQQQDYCFGINKLLVKFINVMGIYPMLFNKLLYTYYIYIHVHVYQFLFFIKNLHDYIYIYIQSKV